MTVRELKEIINRIPEEYLDKDVVIRDTHDPYYYGTHGLDIVDLIEEEGDIKIGVSVGWCGSDTNVEGYEEFKNIVMRGEK